MLTPDSEIEGQEPLTRDRQAAGYLQHSKFSTQKESVRRFIDDLPMETKKHPVLDLGCGPGPSTKMLNSSGFEAVISCDFSMQSLLLNKEGLGTMCGNQLFVRVDLNHVLFASQSCGVLLMTDFLQHLGDWVKQKKFLEKASDALMVGGRYYLSCFNLNIKNYLRGDIHGSFCGDSIKYTRNHYKEMRKILPESMSIDELYPMNIFNDHVLDKFARRMPGALFLSRMLVVTGRRMF